LSLLVWKCENVVRELQSIYMVWFYNGVGEKFEVAYIAMME
jgi:hypothetical protein